LWQSNPSGEHDPSSTVSCFLWHCRLFEVGEIAFKLNDWHFIKDNIRKYNCYVLNDHDERRDWQIDWLIDYENDNGVGDNKWSTMYNDIDDDDDDDDDDDIDETDDDD